MSNANASDFLVHSSDLQSLTAYATDCWDRVGA